MAATCSCRFISGRLAADFPGEITCGYFNLPKAATETGLALWDDYDAEMTEAAWRCALGVAAAISAGEFWPPNERIRPEYDQFAALFHHGAAESVNWREWSAMKPIGHVMILASAGSGKTYRLTNRFVRLLALGARPERIVALTFTRKAAGEFFDEILNKLARAARQPAFAAQLAADIGVPRLGPPDFMKMLRDVTNEMHRLRLGTFDGFFARIARNFPLELGLAGDFEILQEHAARMERARVLRQMLRERGRAQRRAAGVHREAFQARDLRWR